MELNIEQYSMRGWLKLLGVTIYFTLSVISKEISKHHWIAISFNRIYISTYTWYYKYSVF